MPLNDSGYPLCEYDFDWEEYRRYYDEAEGAIYELLSEVNTEYLNDEQVKAIEHHIDGAIGCICQAYDKYEEIKDTIIEASEAEFEAQEKADMAGIE